MLVEKLEKLDSRNISMDRLYTSFKIASYMNQSDTENIDYFFDEGIDRKMVQIVENSGKRYSSYNNDDCSMSQPIQKNRKLLVEDEESRMQIGGNDFDNSHSKSWKLPVLVKSSLEKTAKTYRKEFDERKEIQLFGRLKSVVETFLSITLREEAIAGINFRENLSLWKF